MKRHSQIVILLVIFFIFYFPLFFALFQYYCLSDADFFGSPAFEAPDLLSQPACSVGSDKFLVFNGHHDLISILYNRCFGPSPLLSFQTFSFDPTSIVLRC